MKAAATSRAALPASADPDEAVAEYLRDNPDFLARRPELYRTLLPPKRVHGEVLADHMAAMIAAERARIRALEEEIQASIADGRAGVALALRVRLAVLALMRARDVVDSVTQELPPLLRVESCNLVAEAPRARAFLPGRMMPAPMPQETALPGTGVRLLPQGMVATLLSRGKDAVIRTSPTETELLHGEAAPLVTRDALVRVPVWCGTPCLLALGAREAAALPARQSQHTFAFLGRAIAAALAR